MDTKQVIAYLEKEGFNVVSWKPEKINLYQLVTESWASLTMDSGELKAWAAGYAYHKNFTTPDLLAVCEKLAAWDKSSGDVQLISEACSMARAAIVKAKKDVTR